MRPFRRRCLWLLLVALMGCKHLVSPSGIKGQGEQTRKVAASGGGSVYAVLIGIARYKDRRIQRLKYTLRDVRGLYRVLTGPGRVPRSHIKLLLGEEATRWKIIRALRGWLRRKVGPKDTALVYFSGHGGLGADDLTYWITYDTEYGRVERMGLDHESVNGYLGRLRTKRTVLFVDACHSGFAMKGMRAGASFKGSSYGGQGRVVIASSRQSQYSVEHKKVRHGVFTYTLMKALEGKADGNGDGRVTLLEAWGYLTRHVTALAIKVRGYRQQPVLYGVLTGEIPLSFPPRVPGRLSRAEPRREAQQPKGKLKLVSVPSGATVYNRRGADMGETPLEVELKPGEHVLTLRKEGYKRKTLRLVVYAGRRRVKLVRLQAKVPIERPVARRREEEPRRVPPPPRRRQERRRRAGTVRRVRGMSGMKEVYIPAGSFTMGSPKGEPGRESGERQRRVRLSRGFWMLQTEVTQGQFKALLKYNPSTFSSCGDRCPVDTVNWYEALAYANALSKKGEKEECYSCSGSGKGVKCSVRSKYRGKRYYSCPGYRLPTEAEWEYAYRAGTTTAFYTGRCLSTDEANYNGNYPQEGCPQGKYRGKTVVVKSFGANGWGLYDMAGNVYEWCWDWYGKYTGSRVVDPVGARTGSNRVNRGGSWYFDARFARAAIRDWNVPGRRSNYLGFRLVRADPR